MKPGAPRATVWGIAAIVLHLLLGVFPYAFTGLMSMQAAVLLMVLWVVLLVVVWRLRRRHTPLPLAVPLGAIGLWFAVLWFGDKFLGWSA